MTLIKSEKKLVDKIDYQRLAEFRYALRRFLKFSEAAAESVGLTSRQHQALLAIKGSNHNQLTNGELAEWLQIKHHSAVGLVNRLESQKLIFRQQSEDDKREVFIRLTEQGAEILEQLSDVHQKELRHIAPKLSEILENFNE